MTASFFPLVAYATHLRNYSDLSPNARLVGLVLTTYADRTTGEAWPGLDRLANGTGKGCGMVKAGLRELLRTGCIERLTRGRPGYHSVYRLVAPATATWAFGCPPSLQDIEPRVGGQPVDPTQLTGWSVVQPVLSEVCDRQEQLVADRMREAAFDFHRMPQLVEMLLKCIEQLGAAAVIEQLTARPLGGSRNPLAVVYSRLAKLKDEGQP